MATSASKNDTKHDFTVYHGKKIAVVLSIQGKQKVCRGTASYKFHAALGPVLAVRIEGEENHGVPELLLSETSWLGGIGVDTQYGCDYCFVPSASAAEAGC